MRIIISIGSLIILLIASISLHLVNCEMSGTCDQCCIYDKTLRQVNIMQNINFVFELAKQKMDLIFVVKNSQGFEQMRLSQVKSFISNLTDYLGMQRYLVVHPDYARISILTFADTVISVMNGVSDLSGYYDACRLPSYIDEIQLSTLSDSSDPYNVLKAAFDIFANSGRNVTKILFYFDNGGDWLESISLGPKPGDIVAKMKEIGVLRFAAGVGLPPLGWMDSLQREQNVQSIASDTSNYYACMDDWTVAINKAWEGMRKVFQSANEIKGNSSQFGHLYTYSPVRGKNCQSLTCAATEGDQSCGCRTPSQLLCACDVLAHQYTCQTCDTLFSCVTTPTSSTFSTSTPAVGGSTLSTTWIIVIAVVGGGFLLIIIIVIIIVIQCSRKASQEKSYPAPMPPPPRLRKGDNMFNFGLENGGKDENVYGNVQNAEYAHITNGLQQSNRADVVIMANNDIYAKGRSLEKGMPGWPDYLADSALSLTHLCIIGLSGNRWAQTNGGRFVRVREAREISALFKSPNRNKTSTLRAAGYDYVINWDKCEENIIRASRRLKAQNEQREILLTSAARNYVIVGVSTENRERDCMDAVRHVLDHLETLRMQDEPNLDPLYGQQIDLA